MLVCNLMIFKWAIKVDWMEWNWNLLENCWFVGNVKIVRNLMNFKTLSYFGHFLRWLVCELTILMKIVSNFSQFLNSRKTLIMLSFKTVTKFLYLHFCQAAEATNQGWFLYPRAPHLSYSKVPYLSYPREGYSLILP